VDDLETSNAAHDCLIPVVVFDLAAVGHGGKYGDALFALANVALELEPPAKPGNLRCIRALHGDEHAVHPRVPVEATEGVDELEQCFALSGFKLCLKFRESVFSELLRAIFFHGDSPWSSAAIRHVQRMNDERACRRPEDGRTRQVKVESFAKQKQQRTLKAGADLDAVAQSEGPQSKDKQILVTQSCQLIVGVAKRRQHGPAARSTMR